MAKTYRGVVVADTIEVRFAFAGKVTSVNKKMGDSVKKGDLLASLDKKSLQTELEKELADYERARAHFDKADEKEKTDLQLTLNVSVKNVELAKFRLDAAELYSPVEGLIIDDGCLRPGLYITPAGSPIKIIDIDSLGCRFEANASDLPLFSPVRKIKVFVPEIAKTSFNSETGVPIPNGRGKFIIFAKLPKEVGCVPGLGTEVKI